MNALFKMCGKCKTKKRLSEFTRDRKKKDELCNYCRSCTRTRNEKYAQENKEKECDRAKIYRQKYKAEIKAYRQEHKAEFRIYSENYYQNHKEEARSWNQKNKTKANQQRNIRYKKNINFKINRNMSSSIRQSLKTNKGGKSWKSCVDYTLNELIKRLKSTLPKGYTWNDYINGADLHIDHVVPKSVFNITSIDCTDFKRCWALKNLRLLPGIENMSKHAKIIEHFQPSLTGF